MPEDTDPEIEIQEIIITYRRQRDQLLDDRDRRIREVARKHSMRQMDVIRATGLSRETVRRVLDPAVREAIRGR